MHTQRFAQILFLAYLAACGGGSSSADSDAPPKTTDENPKKNTAPEISILQPDGANDPSTGTFTTTWTDSDPDDLQALDRFKFSTASVS